MSTNYYYGDNVNVHGGQHITGMIKNQTAPAAPVSPELQTAIHELLELVRELRSQVSPASARAIDDSVSDIAAGATTPAQERHRALMAVAGIAATVGAVGQPVIDAVNKILELL
ncbi:hypothetical protein [Streptomyces asiaticus]